jgi:hypothetical protein
VDLKVFFEMVGLTKGEFYVTKYYFLLIVTETTKYALRAADPWAANRLAGG